MSRLALVELRPLMGNGFNPGDMVRLSHFRRMTTSAACRLPLAF